ncbi:MAG: glycosyltransferase family 4 protein [Planctomycetota bacterium]|nr:glycosyltransferase family 4 protein [Planctomycetota bacterium]
MHIFHVDPEMGFSGGEVQVFLLIDGLVERGHTCTVVAQPDSLVEKAAKERNLRTVSVRMRGDWDYLAVRRISWALSAAQPDVVHLHTGRANWLGGWAAKREGIPAISTRRMDRRVKNNRKSRRIYGSFVQHTAAISPAVLRQLHEGGVPPERSELIWSVVDPSKLQPSRPRGEMRKELGLEESQSTVLAAGALVARKGFDCLIEAIARVESRPMLCIAGEGPAQDELWDLALGLGLSDRVKLLGKRKDMPDLLGAADLFAMPSRAEGLGIAALEAMAAGLPVLASEVGGLQDLVLHGETGRLLHAGDVPAWAVAIGQTLADPAETRRMGAAGKERVERSFLPAQMVEAYEKLYRRSCDG